MNKNVEMDQMLSLWGAEDEEKQSCNNMIDVVKADYAGTKRLNWKDLFDGFDELYAITYSSGIDFVSQVISQFGYAEIVFGHGEILDSDIATAMAASKQMVETIAKHKSAATLAERIAASTLSLFVARDSKSHEKVYCLKSNDGRYRVIAGSANLSATAFMGLQRENIICFDSEEAFSYYYNLFCDYKKECSEEVAHSLLGRVAVQNDYLEDHPEEIPVLKMIEKKQTIYLSPMTEESEKEVQFVADVKNISNDIKPIMPVFKKQGNNVIIRSEKYREARKRLNEQFAKKKELKKVNPKLHIDYDAGRLFFNNEEISLSPAREDVARDVNCLVGYLESLSKFNNEWDVAQKNYYKFMNWFFASPFMAKLRLTANRNGYTTTLFPVVGSILAPAVSGSISSSAAAMSALDIPFMRSA